MLVQLTCKMLGFSPSAAVSTGPSTGSTSGTEELSITQQPEQNQQSLEELPVCYLEDLGFPSTASAAVPVCSQTATQLALLLKRKGKKITSYWSPCLVRVQAPWSRAIFPLGLCPAWMAAVSQGLKTQMLMSSGIYVCRERHRRGPPCQRCLCFLGRNERVWWQVQAQMC